MRLPAGVRLGSAGRALPGEDALPAIPYLRALRWVHAEAAEVDAVLCVLEALAQAGAPPPALLLEALDHPDVLVRWTAARLTPDGAAYDTVRARGEGS